MATYYAGVGGSDANAGTSYALRKLTIQAAVNIATTAGDTVLVSPGTYRETVTMGTSGTAGNVNSLIGDYTGANTSGTKGVVRITGSANDIALTRANCIVASSKNYITITGFVFDSAANDSIIFTTCTYITISKCFITGGATYGYAAVQIKGASTNVTVSQCYINTPLRGTGVYIQHTANVDNAGHVIENCSIIGNEGTTHGVMTEKVGGIIVRNCTLQLTYFGIRIGTAVTAGQTVTVNNCILRAHTIAFQAVAADGTLVENYNAVSDCAVARTNTTAGANSVARPPLWDTRWFWEMVNGGRMVTPFDLASYSQIVEYTSGTGAPSTDLRGASVVGTYREWGALEYDSTLSIAGGGASRVIGSPFIRGLGAV